jgi:MtN3 and saliva related transmembrane protein
VLAVLGFSATLLTTGAWLPQLIRCWRTRSADDLSWSYLLVLALGVAMWGAYGVASGDPILVLANSVTLVAMGTLGTLKVVFGARPATADSGESGPDLTLR